MLLCVLRGPLRENTKYSSFLSFEDLVFVSGPVALKIIFNLMSKHRCMLHPRLSSKTSLPTHTAQSYRSDLKWLKDGKK